MGWRDELQQGKFRGAPFFFGSADGELGRRVAVHQYPGRDLPYAEDMGRRARTWNLDLYVLGERYMAGRDALIAALEQPGPGTLVHPYLGTLTVVVVSARGPRESTRHGGMARFEVTFLEAGDNTYPSAASDTKANVATWAYNARESVAVAFVAAYSIERKPAWVPSAAQALLTTVLDNIDTLARRFPAVPRQATALVAAMSEVRGALDVLVRQPHDLAQGTTGLIGKLASLFSAPTAVIQVCTDLWLSGDNVVAVPQTTASRRQQATNQDAILAMMRQSAVVEACAVVPTLPFASTADAFATRDLLDERLDIEMATASDEIYHALAELRVAMIRDIAARPDLARLLPFTPAATQPALALSYRLYGNTSQADDMVARNHVRHPGFVPGGSVLEVVAND